MKTSSIVASVLFGSMAAAAPMLNKRAFVTHTSTLIQTEVTYTTVYADEVAAQASKTNGAFFEKPTVSSKPAPSSTAVVQASSAVKPSSIASSRPTSAVPPPPPAPTTSQVVSKTTSQAPVVQPTTTKAPAVQPTTSQAPVVKPSSTSVVAPVVAPSSVVAPKPSASSAPSTGGGATHSGGSLTIHEFNGQLGACGKNLANTDMVVALGKELWGQSTHDIMTGESTNPNCGMKINITYNGKTVPAKIMDLCDGGCTGAGLDVSQGVWDQLVNGPRSRLTGMTWSPA